MATARIYDQRASRVLRRDELPSDISLRQLDKFLRAHEVSFHSCEVFVPQTASPENDWKSGRWERRDNEFRASTHAWPSRGINVSFDRVREWLAKLIKINIPEAKKICEELPLLEDRMRRAGLFITAAALNKAVQKIGFEVCEIIKQAKVAMGEETEDEFGG